MPAYSVEIQKWYNCRQWQKLRKIVLARDPVCVICLRLASVIADHIIPHKGKRELFWDLTNLQGLCRSCHSTKTAAEDGGYGNAPKPARPQIQRTGDGGREFSSSSIPRKQLDAAMDFNVDDLLSGL